MFASRLARRDGREAKEAMSKLGRMADFLFVLRDHGSARVTVDGVWIGDASAFPTASGANPMLTCMALAHRTAELLGGSRAEVPAVARPAAEAALADAPAA